MEIIDLTGELTKQKQAFLLHYDVPQKTHDSYMAVRALVSVCIVDH